MAQAYLEPIGLSRGAEADALRAVGLCAPLAGGPVSFSALRVWQRRDGGGATHQVLTIEQAQAQFREQFAALTAPRDLPCGLDPDATHVMGILNVTPDSFSDGGRFNAPDQAIRQAQAMVAHGAAIIDIGGESTRPGADPVTIADELARTVPVIDALRDGGLPVPISLDTRRAAVMRNGLLAGADIINDVSALGHDAESPALLAQQTCPIIVMHAQGTPKTMQQDPTYDVALLDIYDDLAAIIHRAEQAGIDRQRLVIDPGIGFGKTLAHNLHLLNGLALFHGLGCPLLLGASRKRFIAGIDPNGAAADDRIGGSLAAVAAAFHSGVQLVRVHDVSQSVQWLAVATAIANGLSSD